MDSVENIINWMFGGSVDVSKILTIVVALYAIVQGIVAWRSKIATIKANGQLKAQSEEITQLHEENKQVKEAMSSFANVICIAYLSNPGIDPETKKLIATEAKKLDKVAELDLSDVAEKAIDVIDKYVPGTGVADRKAEISANAQLVEEAIDGANEGVQSAIDSIHLD